MKKFLSAVLASILAVGTLAGPIRPPKGFDGKVFDSTLVLYGTKKGVAHSLCTVEPYEAIPGGYHLVTAGHCILGVPEGIEFSVADNIGSEQMPVKVLKASASEKSNIDFAELELITKKKYTIIPFGTEEGITVGDQVINANFSEMVGKQLSLGRVSSQPLVVSEDVPAGGKDYFLIQVYGASGSSGSAVISKKTHKIIGIVVYGFDSNIGMGVEPISLYQKFLTEPAKSDIKPEADSAIDEIIKIITGN